MLQPLSPLWATAHVTEAPSAAMAATSTTTAVRLPVVARESRLGSTRVGLCRTGLDGEAEGLPVVQPATVVSQSAARVACRE